MVTTTIETELLTEAREFISDPERWTQGILALDGDGRRVVGERMINARRCCAVGALQLAGVHRGLDRWALAVFEANDLLDRAALKLHPQSENDEILSPAAWVNDHLGHEAVLRVYDAAIAASRETNHA